MAEDPKVPPPSNPLTGLLRRLFGGGASTAATPAPVPTSYAAPDMTITDENRADLLYLAQNAPFAYGYWAQVKKLYKTAEAAQDRDILGALITRLDTQPFIDTAAPVTMPLGEHNIGGILKIKVSGTIACLVSQSRNPNLRIADISDPVYPRLVGQFEVPRAIDLIVEGNRAYVLEPSYTHNQLGGVHVVDISQPTNPRNLGHADIRYATSIAQYGPYLAVLFGDYRSSGLTILDLANPSSPITVGTLQINLPNASMLVVQGQVGYVLTNQKSSGQQKIAVVDLATPTQPRQMSVRDAAGTTGIAVAGNYFYRTTGRAYYSDTQSVDGLSIYHLSDLDKRVGFLSGINAQLAAVVGRYAYVGVGGQRYADIEDGGLHIVDVADPTQPRLVGKVRGGKILDVAPPTENTDTIFFSMERQRYAGGAFCAANIARPEQPLLLSTLPSNKTFGYMKRRARRALRNLAEQDPTQYVYLATQILTATGKGRNTLDTRIQWVSMDILYGGSRRYEQAGHGRGAYLSKGKHLSLRTREEAYPYLWDRHPLLAESLYTLAELPWQTHEAACKMLRGNSRDLPVVPDATLLRFLQSSSPLLVTVACRALAAQMERGQQPAPDLAAEAFFKGGGRTRTAVRDYIARQTLNGSLNSKWTNPFASRLYKLASENVADGSLSRRQGIAFAYLVATFPNVLSRQAAPALAALLYATRRPELMAWTLATLRQASATQLDQWLKALEPLSDDLRVPALAALSESLQSKPISPAMMTALINDTSTWIRAATWDMIARSRTPDADLAKVWDDLLTLTSETDALRTATASPAAIALFNRLSLDGSRLQNLLETRPFLVGLLPQSALLNIVRILPPASILNLVRASMDAQWPELRVTITDALSQAGQNGAFWKLAWQAVGASGDPTLAARLLADDVMSATFMQTDDVEVLDTSNPVYGPILGRWVRAHDGLFQADSPYLLKIATHTLPDIRAFGLERARQVGMRMPFALRLLESELPPSVALGREFFEGVTPGDACELEYATALCDSPKPPVRQYGREYAEARWERLPHSELFSRLSENPDVQTEAFLARKMLTTDERFAGAEVFDRQVLRGRDKGRKAKELVKRRLDAQPSQDVGLLLEMTRSRSSRDAEWALGQLARLALDGVEIEGFSVEGFSVEGLEVDGSGVGSPAASGI